MITNGAVILSRTPVRWRTAAIVVASIAYALIHLVTLARSPTPWFDDTFFASVTRSLLQTGELRLPVSPLWLDKPVYAYGPVYFFIAGFFTKLFGFDIFQFRLTGLLFGFAVIWLVYRLLHERKIAGNIVLASCLLLALDPTFYKCIHNGRMDSTALSFILLSLLLAIRKPAQQSRDLYRMAFSGLCAAIGILTTPRPIYLLAPIGAILVYRWWREKNRQYLLQMLVWGGVIVCVYALWFFYAFGNIGNFLAYYGTLPGGTYLGGFHIRLEHYPLLLGLLVLGIALPRGRRKLLADELLFFALAGIAGFYLIVHDVGPYAFFMIPLAYLALASLADKYIEAPRRRLIYAVIGCLLFINGLSFLARNALVSVQWEARDEKEIESAITRAIPSGSRVVGDDRYYFAVIGTGSDFQYLERGGTLEERATYHKNVYRADFLISAHSEESTIIKRYKNEFSLVKWGTVGVTRETKTAEWISHIAARVGFSADTGYKGVIWMRSDNEWNSPKGER